MRLTVLLAATFALIPGLCLAQQASAIVEDVQAEAVAVSQFDYVAPGQVIDLGSEGTLTLGYLSSCERERIVSTRFSGSVVAMTKITRSGGSSSVFNNAFEASPVSM